MDIGTLMFLTDCSIDVAVLAKRAEEIGLESFWVPEHPILPVRSQTPWPGSPDGVIPKVYADIVDPFVALGRVSAVTTDLKLGTGICLVLERNPLVLAKKEVATLDMYSGGTLSVWNRCGLAQGGDADHGRRFRPSLDADA